MLHCIAPNTPCNKFSEFRGSEHNTSSRISSFVLLHYTVEDSETGILLHCYISPRCKSSAKPASELNLVVDIVETRRILQFIILVLQLKRPHVLPASHR